jgi:hypothetical protein
MTLGARRQPRETLSALDRITEIIGSVLYRLAGPQPTKTRHRVAFRGMSENVSGTFERLMFFLFPPDARWKPDRSAVEFSVAVGEYEGVVRVSRRVFRIPSRDPHA